MISISDNYLEDKDLFALQNTLFSEGFPMYYIPKVAYENDNSLGCYYMIHTMYEYPKGWLSGHKELIQPLLDKLEVKSLVKIKINYYPRTDKLLLHGLHRDNDFECKSALLFVNSNDGYTYLKKKNMKVESVANRVLHFNSFFDHHSTTCTDQNLRCTINVNYF